MDRTAAEEPCIAEVTTHDRQHGPTTRWATSDASRSLVQFIKRLTPLTEFRTYDPRRSVVYSLIADQVRRRKTTADVKGYKRNGQQAIEVTH